ncbi:MAG TPA: type II toxin-antitoxin system PemK/MazF family toxin [Bryobacteraceae bacterium]|nr:type II toxin-antitoxin system PemK/MazF family toxin [Bryobacteraceae bacterium]
MKPYEVWWADLPKPAGRRPVLLLTRTHAYAYLHKFVVAEITSTVRGIPIEVPLGSREGFTKPCLANCDNLRTVARSRLVQRLGALHSSRQNEVKRAIGYAFAWEELIGVE